jgi:predicted nucleic-acid-binding Zn-ribbon protein
MPDEPKTCPKCRGAMARGFFYSGGMVTPWFEGEPKTFLFGMVKPPSGHAFPTAAFRCSQCGYLEMYAGAEYAAR